MRRLLALISFILLTLSGVAAQPDTNYLVRGIGSQIVGDQVVIDFTVINNGVAENADQSAHLFDANGAILASSVIGPLGSDESVRVSLTVPLGHFTPGAAQTIYVVVGLDHLPPLDQLRGYSNFGAIQVLIPIVSPTPFQFPTQNVIIPLTPSGQPAQPTTTLDEMPGTVNVGVQSLNVRSGPGLDFPSVGTLASGQTVVVGVNPDRTWYKVLYNGFDGWVMRDYVNVSGDTSSLPVDEGPYVAATVPPTQQQSISAATSVPPQPTIIVNTLLDNPTGCPQLCTLRSAIASANPSDVIGFDSAVSGVMELADTLVINKDLTIIGPGPAKLALDGSSLIQVISLQGSGLHVSISGLTIQNGESDSGGGGISSQGNTLVISNCAFANNVARAINSFQASDGGAIDSQSDTLTITNTSFSNNVAQGSGGGIGSNNSTLVVSNSTFSNNSAQGTGSGGGISSGGELDVTSSTFSNNSAAYEGGAISGTMISIQESSFTDNSADNGGGIASENGQIVVFASTFLTNTAQDAGGGIYSNSANSGVLSLHVEGTTFSGNSAQSTDNGGGGIYNSGGNFLAYADTFSANETQGNGGGIETSGNAQIESSTFSSNIANGNGGGVANALNGGLFAAPVGGTLYISNSTFTANNANSGGGIRNRSVLNISNSTVSGNSVASSGGGIDNSQGDTVTLTSTIVADNTAGDGPDIAGKFHSGGYNLVGSSSGTVGFFASDQKNVDPKLSSLADNGGPTQTIALQVDSPAIGMGNCDLVTTDQRGISRKTPCDVGAYETLGASATESPTAVPAVALSSNSLTWDKPSQGFVSLNGSSEWIFSANGGEIVNVCAHADVDAFQPHVSVLDPNGHPIANGDNTVQDVMMSVSGQYRIEVASAASSWGSYQVEITHWQAGQMVSCIFSDLTFPNPYCQSNCVGNWPIAYGETWTQKINKAKRLDIWSFQGNQGNAISITMTPHDPSLNSQLALKDAGGNVLMSAHGEGTLASQITAFTLPQSGNYTIEATSADELSTGIYDISLSLISESSSPISATQTTLQMTATSLPDHCILYSLKDGDTPFGIATQYNIDGNLQLAVNGLNDQSASLLQIGQVIIVPLLGCSLVAPQATATPTLFVSPTFVFG